MAGERALVMSTHRQALVVPVVRHRESHLVRDIADLDSSGESPEFGTRLMLAGLHIGVYRLALMTN
jgi:hypothetical protein